MAEPAFQPPKTTAEDLGIEVAADISSDGPQLVLNVAVIFRLPSGQLKPTEAQKIVAGMRMAEAISKAEEDYRARSAESQRSYSYGRKDIEREFLDIPAFLRKQADDDESVNPTRPPPPPSEE